MLVKVFLFQLARIIHALSGLGLGYKTELQNARNTDLFTKQSGPKGPGFGLPRREWLKVQGTGHRAQGKNNKRKRIVSLYLAPCALCLKSLMQAKPFNVDLALRTRFSIFNKIK